jgi:hypothetical protein
MIGAAGGRAIGNRQGLGRFPSHQGAIDRRVVAADLVMDAANNREFVGLQGQPRQRLRDGHPWRARGDPAKRSAHFLGCSRLGVEGIALIGPTYLEEDDAGTGPVCDSFRCADGRGATSKKLEKGCTAEGNVPQAQELPAIQERLGVHGADFARKVILKTTSGAEAAGQGRRFIATIQML